MRRELNHSIAPLASHLDSQNVEFMQFAFRWMNCLLMREITVRNTIRMWDTYLVCLTYIVFVFITYERLLSVVRGCGCILSVSSLCMLCFLDYLER